MWDSLETQLTKYKMFELKKNTALKVLIAYVKDNEIINIKKEKVNLKEKNMLSKEELADLLIKNKTLDNDNYNSYKIMNFNLNLEAEGLENFLEDEMLKEEDTTFTNNYSNLVDVNLDDSINMFQDLNMIMIILQKRKPSRNHTRSNRRNLLKDVKHISCNIKKRRTKKFLNIQ